MSETQERGAEPIFREAMPVSTPEGGDPAQGKQALPAGAWRGWRWWLRLVEVRLRFVVIVLLILGVVTQWQRLRTAWDDRWHALRASPAVSGVSSDLEFFCPMDPGVVSVWPAICPICNMDLVQRKKHEAQLLPEGVVARMQLSPYRVQLAGIRTAAVEERECFVEIPVSGVLQPAPVDGPGGASAAAADLCFIAPLSRADEPLLTMPRDATVRADGGIEEHPATANMFNAHQDDAAQTTSVGPRQILVRLSSAAGLAAGMTVEGFVRAPVLGGDATAQPWPTVPASSVVDHGFQQLVFVESMPGTFDAMTVRLGRRCGDFYPVLSGIKTVRRTNVA